MKTLAILALSLFSSSAFAIEFITEAQVQQAIGADKIIAISRSSAKVLVAGKDADCEMDLNSRSARAYVVKKDNGALLVVTPSGLDGLRNCGSL